MLVTGGTGLVGKGIEEAVANDPVAAAEEEYIFLSSKVWCVCGVSIALMAAEDRTKKRHTKVRGLLLQERLCFTGVHTCVGRQNFIADVLQSISASIGIEKTAVMMLWLRIITWLTALLHAHISMLQQLVLQRISRQAECPPSIAWHPAPLTPCTAGWRPTGHGAVQGHL